MDFRAYFGKTIHAALIREEYKSKVSYEYSLAIFNSKYINFLYHQRVLERGRVFPQVKLKYLRDLPFIVGSKAQQNKISDMVKKMIDLNKQVMEQPENSNTWRKIKDEIEKTNQKIDEEIYKLYSLTPEEINIVEGK